MPKDYGNLPISALIRGPLLTTPAGWTVVLALVFYWGLGAVSLLWPFGPFADGHPEVDRVVCALWPVVYFVRYLQVAMPFGFYPPRWPLLMLALWWSVPLIIWSGLKLPWG